MEEKNKPLTQSENDLIRKMLKEVVPERLITEKLTSDFLETYRSGKDVTAFLLDRLSNIIKEMDSRLVNSELGAKNLKEELSILQDITNDLKSSFNEFATIDELLSSEKKLATPSEVLDGLIDFISRCLPITGSKIFLIDQNTRAFDEICKRDMTAKREQEIEIRLEEGTFAWAIREGGPVVIPMNQKNGLEKSLIICPLILSGNPLGIACFFSSFNDSEYTPQIFQIIKSLARRAAMSVSNAIKVNHLQRESEKVGEIKDYLNLIVNSIAQGIIVITNNDNISLFNRTSELIIGVEESHVINRKYQDCLPPKLAQLLDRLVNRCRNDDPVVDYEFEFNRGEGVVFRLGITSIPITDNKGEFGSILFTLRDLFTTKELTRLQQSDKYKSLAINRFKEDLRDVERQLQRNEKMASIGQMSAGVAHEINNPLGSIAGFIQIMLLDCEEESSNKKYLTAMNQEVSRMKSIVEELLAFARQQPGTTQVVMPVDLNLVIRETLSLLKPQAKLNQVRVEFEEEEKLPSILGQPDRIKQTIMNMCLNAFAAMNKAENLLMIKTMLNGDAENNRWVDIIIEDNGEGIRKEHLSKIFDPFFTTREQGKGTGLGLSTCYAIIEQHGGSIDVSSRWKEGTKFTISLPVIISEK